MLCLQHALATCYERSIVHRHTDFFLITSCGKECVITKLSVSCTLPVSLKCYWTCVHNLLKTCLISVNSWKEAEEAFLHRRSIWDQRSRPKEPPEIRKDTLPKQTPPPLSAESDNRPQRWALRVYCSFFYAYSSRKIALGYFPHYLKPLAVP